MLAPQPLGLYIHLPWCVSKCPYCDFNSHALKGELPAEDYLEALMLDLQADLPMAWGRTVSTVFFGGGTPSLFSADQIDRILCQVRSLVQLSPEAEITLEANPGTIEYDSFSSYRHAGINRVSLGAQSFDDDALRAIGRIHGSDEIQRAVESLKSAGMDNFNIDLMYGLPGQTVDGAVNDVMQALACIPTHVSHYQLTLEPNTRFAASPPKLPGDDIQWEMQEECSALFVESGFQGYEISAWSRPDKVCRHNLNYWRFGDYLGIGAGAHSKITLNAESRIVRLAKHRHPKQYMDARNNREFRAEMRALSPEERVFEYFLNRLRLSEPIKFEEYSGCTGLDPNHVAPMIESAVNKGLLEVHQDCWVQTELGRRFNNDLQAIFLK
ncbi:MAG TPA: radical SAM family heme chaperone HemW [Xanthomonadales bacterium]|nr:radical SAM family heme chaperone HemW [Xanthomonadales bacterium]